MRGLLVTILFVLLCLPQPVRAVEWGDPPSEYGIGIITCPPESGYLTSACFRDLSDRSAPAGLFAEPAVDTLKGTVLEPDSSRGWNPFRITLNNGGRGNLDNVEVGYESTAIVIQEKQGDWYRNDEGWLYGPSVGLGTDIVYKDWLAVLNLAVTEGGESEKEEEERSYIGWLFPLAAQPLHETPGGTVAGALWESENREDRPDLLVLERRGEWIKVQLDHKGTICTAPDKNPEGATGWVRMVNDAGNPLVYWCTRGC